jgi:hypothetical protein
VHLHLIVNIKSLKIFHDIVLVQFDWLVDKIKKFIIEPILGSTALQFFSFTDSQCLMIHGKNFYKSSKVKKMI